VIAQLSSGAVPGRSMARHATRGHETRPRPLAPSGGRPKGGRVRSLAKAPRIGPNQICLTSLRTREPVLTLAVGGSFSLGGFVAGRSGLDRGDGLSPVE
jgi:hypothetical protein